MSELKGMRDRNEGYVDWTFEPLPKFEPDKRDEEIERLRQQVKLLTEDIAVRDVGYEDMKAGLEEEITRLRKIEAAAKNLIAVKGRHHAEIAYKRLEDTLKGETE